MNRSSIEWTDFTWNPLRGCSRVSEGCRHCYAEMLAARFSGPGMPFRGFALMTPHGPHWTGKVKLIKEQLVVPLKMVRPRKIFVNSMSDLFHEALPVPDLERICRVMVAARWHTFQVLTKRAERMAEMLAGPLHFAADSRHIWWGTSVENRKVLHRIDSLRGAPVPNRFLSIEPLLEDLGDIDLAGIHWVIVGGESGSKSRPMEADWVRSIKRQCRDHGTRFFFKQWGGVHKKDNGNLLDGRRYLQLPPFVRHAVPTRKARTAMVHELEDSFSRKHQLVSISA